MRISDRMDCYAHYYNSFDTSSTRGFCKICLSGAFFYQCTLLSCLSLLSSQTFPYDITITRIPIRGRVGVGTVIKRYWSESAEFLLIFIGNVTSFHLVALVPVFILNLFDDKNECFVYCSSVTGNYQGGRRHGRRHHYFLLIMLTSLQLPT